MRFEEAFKAMRDGKTVICIDDEVIYKIEDSNVIRKYTHSNTWCGGNCMFSVLSENWEILDEQN